MLRAIKRLGGSASTGELDAATSRYRALPDEAIAKPHNERRTESGISACIGRDLRRRVRATRQLRAGVWVLTAKGKAVAGVDPRQTAHQPTPQERLDRLLLGLRPGLLADPCHRIPQGGRQTEQRRGLPARPVGARCRCRSWSPCYRCTGRQPTRSRIAGSRNSTPVRLSQQASVEARPLAAGSQLIQRGQDAEFVVERPPGRSAARWRPPWLTPGARQPATAPRRRLDCADITVLVSSSPSSLGRDSTTAAHRHPPACFPETVLTYYLHLSASEPDRGSVYGKW